LFFVVVVVIVGVTCYNLASLKTSESLLFLPIFLYIDINKLTKVESLIFQLRERKIKNKNLFLKSTLSLTILFRNKEDNKQVN